MILLSFIASFSLLLLFLHLCKELRDFCGFTKIPDASLLSRFKHDFEPYIERMFQRMVDYTEPICQMIDSSLAQMLTFDTSGIDKSIYQSPNLVFKKQHIFLDMLAFLYDLIILPLLA